MKFHWKTLILLALLFPVTTVWGAPAQVLIIRHGEKPDVGIELSPRGWERAKALVGYFETNPAVRRFGPPVAIYAMGQKRNKMTSLRPIETVTPLAQALGLPILSQYSRYKIQDLVNEIMTSPQYDGKMVLVCWEHNMIPSIATLFGVSTAPAAWSDSVFDQVWEIDFTSNGAVSTFKTFSEKVLPGDG